jgi:hypothetical protein
MTSCATPSSLASDVNGLAASVVIVRGSGGMPDGVIASSNGMSAGSGGNAARAVIVKKAAHTSVHRRVAVHVIR